MAPTELSDPITVQIRLPVDVLERMKAEAERDVTTVSYLVRRSCVREYGRGSLLPDDGTNRIDEVRNIPDAGRND